MSGVVKSAKKIFKKVAKVAKIVVPLALAAAAIYFTAGAALGVAGMAGGWGAAAGSLGTALGGSGMLGSVLTGAITQAGFGAVIGGGLAFATGNDPLKGAALGAAGGAVTGGVSGLFGVAGAPAVAGGKASEGVINASTGDILGSGLDLGGAAVDPAGLTGAGPVLAGGPNGFVPPAGKSMFDITPGSLADRFLSPEVIGGAIQGLGKGGFEYLAAKDQGESDDRDAERLAASYRGLGLLGRQAGGPNTNQGGQSPNERFAQPGNIGGQFYRDPKTGRLVRIQGPRAALA